MKMKFDELVIELPFPHRTVYFGVDKQGRAPPLRLARADPAGQASAQPEKAAARTSDRSHRAVDGRGS